MTSVSMFEAKTNLSKYVAAVESGEEPFIVICRSGKPIARIIPYEQETNTRIGFAEGSIPYLSSLEEFNSIPVEEDFLSNGGIL